MMEDVKYTERTVPFVPDEITARTQKEPSLL